LAGEIKHSCAGAYPQALFLGKLDTLDTLHVLEAHYHIGVGKASVAFLHLDDQVGAAGDRPASFT
jgi:hypothetical protein